MIISHKHKFIFIKTRKTAGTSLEISLGSHCGPEDVITRISMKDEKVRRKIAMRGAQNYRLPFRTYGRNDWAELFFKGRWKRFENHDRADKLINYLTAEQWNGYFKFCFERNPWDKMVSHYFWKKEPYHLKDFHDYLMKGEQGLIDGFDAILETRDQYSIDGKVAVDKIYKYEEMDEALDDLTSRLSLSSPLRMPDYRAKGQHRDGRINYHEILDIDQMAWIENNFKEEVSRFNYKY